MFHRFYRFIQTANCEYYAVRRHEVPVKGDLVITQLPLRGLHFQTDITPLDDANDIRRAFCAEPIKMLLGVNECAAVVAIVKDALEREIVEDLLLDFRLFHLS